MTNQPPKLQTYLSLTIIPVNLHESEQRKLKQVHKGLNQYKVQKQAINNKSVRLKSYDKTCSSRRKQSNQANSLRLSKINQSQRIQTEPLQKSIIKSTLNQIALANQVLPILKLPQYPKPYSQNTKFTDLLIRNQSLLRRGQFETPVSPPFPLLGRQSPPFKDSSSMKQRKFVRSFIAKKQQINIIERKKNQKRKAFHQTLQICSKQYKRVMIHDQQENPLLLKRWMERIIAGEKINEKILKKKHS